MHDARIFLIQNRPRYYIERRGRTLPRRRVRLGGYIATEKLPVVLHSGHSKVRTSAERRKLAR
jgi:hypothetical protein